MFRDSFQSELNIKRSFHRIRFYMVFDFSIYILACVQLVKYTRELWDPLVLVNIRNRSTASMSRNYSHRRRPVLFQGKYREVDVKDDACLIVVLFSRIDVYNVLYIGVKETSLRRRGQTVSSKIPFTLLRLLKLFRAV